MSINFSELFEKPKLYAESESIWTDEYISKGMLKAHLEPEWDAASRRHAFIDASVAWISKLAPPRSCPYLLDLGCGPGLYTERFSRLGYRVTGVDFSKRSIDYARAQAQQSGSKIEYFQKDYLTLDYNEQFDIITLIYCDYAVLSSADRLRLMQLVYRALKKGGRFILDVFSEKMRSAETRTWHYSKGSDFWCDKPHLCLEAVYQYDDEDKTELQQTLICTQESTRCFNVWNHLFTKESLLAEAQRAGFSAHELFGDAAGASYSPDSDTICCVLTK